VNLNAVFSPNRRTWLDIETGQQISADEAWGPEWKAAEEVHKAAMGRWKRREQYAARRTGYAKAREDEKAANAKLDATIHALVAARPRSWAGLIAKARAAHALGDDEAELNAALICDVLALADA